jgi:hypothetical protein
MTLFLATFFVPMDEAAFETEVLLTLQRFNENRWQPLTAFLLKILDNVSNSGRIAGIAASSHRGSTLKGTKVSNLYEYEFHFWPCK